MRIGTMLKDILESFFKNPATQMYPEEKIAPPKRYRGELFYDPKACTGCWGHCRTLWYTNRKPWTQYGVGHALQAP